jgi:glucoside 3-dehydrogenase (cytochrome c) hitch-hiker subunit
MKRREALQVIAAGAAASKAAEASPPEFFSPSQDALLDRLTEMIIPADGHSPGASAAKVSRFIDHVAAHSRPQVQRAWVSGLDAVDDEARRRFQKSFLEASASQQDELLAAIAANEAEPRTPIEHFFVRLKQSTVDGYYTSAIGIHKELEYKGNAALAEFPGCRHGDH